MYSQRMTSLNAEERVLNFQKEKRKKTETNSLQLRTQTGLIRKNDWKVGSSWYLLRQVQETLNYWRTKVLVMCHH